MAGPYIIKGGRPFFQELAEIKRQIALKQREINALKDKRKEVLNRLAECEVEFKE